MRLAEAFQPGLDNAVGKSKESRLHVRRQSGDLSGDSFV